MSLAEIRDYLSYDPDTGIFRWIKKPSNAIQIGSVAGNIPDNRGYREIRFRRRRYYAHRLAWWFVHGEMPPEIDHRFGVEVGDQIKNLRVATHTENMQNSKPHIGSVSRFKGVSLDRRDGRWRVQIMANKRQHCIGQFGTEEEAARIDQVLNESIDEH